MSEEAQTLPTSIKGFDIGSFSLQGKKALEESAQVKAMKFFPFIQLVQSTSNAAGDFKAGTFVFRLNGQDKNPIDLGTAFEAVVLSIRGKSTYFENGVFEVEYHTAQIPESERYIQLRDLAHAENSPSPKYRSGLEVLFWIPSVKSFATFFANSVSSSATLINELSHQVTETVMIRSEQRRNKKGGWYSFTATLIEDESVLSNLETPSNEALGQALTLFVSPPKHEAKEESVIEGSKKVEEPSKRAR